MVNSDGCSVMALSALAFLTLLKFHESAKVCFDISCSVGNLSYLNVYPRGFMYTIRSSGLALITSTPGKFGKDIVDNKPQVSLIMYFL